MNEPAPILRTETKENGLAIFNNVVWLDRGNLICIAARPGMGKTALALHVAMEYAQRCGNTVYIFSLEMSEAQTRSKMMGSLAEVDAYRIREKTLTEEETARMDEAAARLRGMNIVIADETPVSVKDIENKIENDDRIGLIVIDYLQLMTSGSGSADRRQEINEIMGQLAELARKKQIPVIVTSQLWRGLEYRKDKHPRLDDLATMIGELGVNRADTVILLYRDGYYNVTVRDDSDLNKPDEAEVTVAKNRYGSEGTVMLEWCALFVKFREMNEER